jgi:hypothetical protein
MPSTKPKELLVSKVTKESLEDIAFKEAGRVEGRLPWLLLIPVAILLSVFVVPKEWWWLLVPCVVAFAVYFQLEQRKLETLQGRSAGRNSRRPRNSGRAYP